MTSVAFVCLGNICRSPMAEAVFAHKVKQSNLDNQISVDSFGTAGYHIGDPPHTATVSVCRENNVPINHKGQQIRSKHFESLDYIIAMDENNLRSLRRLAPDGAKAKVHLFSDFRNNSEFGRIVEDPYYGPDEGFKHTFAQVSDFSEGLLDHIRSNEL